MGKITLNRALHRKNVIVGKIRKLDETIAGSNSWNVKNKGEWDVDVLMVERRRLSNLLVELKTKIDEANAPIRGMIHRLVELKSMVAMYGGLPTRKGKFTVNARFGGEPFEEEFDCCITEQMKAAEVDVLTSEIERIQEELSSFNYRTTIEFGD